MLDMYRQSRGKGLTDLPAWTARPAMPVPRPALLYLLLLAWAVLLMGCAAPATVTEVYRVHPAVLVVTTDQALIERACFGAKRYREGAVIGCYVPHGQPPAIYCPPNDAETCWHEMFDHHIQGRQH